MMTDTEILKLLNIIGKESINEQKNFREITDGEAIFTDMGLDSLDFVTMFIYTGDIFDMPDEDFNKHHLMDVKGPVPTFNNLITVIKDVGKNLDVTYEEALEQL
ncbi:MAG: hypothetical protein ABGY11_14565 [Candidatus Thioglobus sp.]|jgi:acyl carrier protein